MAGNENLPELISVTVIIEHGTISGPGLETHHIFTKDQGELKVEMDRFVDKLAQDGWRVKNALFSRVPVEMLKTIADMIYPRMHDYLLIGHKCKRIARLFMGEEREWWLGELTEPINGFPQETHCLHIKTPLKEVVLGVNVGDMTQLAVLAQIVHGGPINQHWLENMEKAILKRAQMGE